MSGWAVFSPAACAVIALVFAGAFVWMARDFRRRPQDRWPGVVAVFGVVMALGAAALCAVVVYGPPLAARLAETVLGAPRADWSGPQQAAVWVAATVVAAVPLVLVGRSKAGVAAVAAGASLVVAALVWFASTRPQGTWTFAVLGGAYGGVVLVAVYSALLRDWHGVGRWLAPALAAVAVVAGALLSLPRPG